MVQAVFYLVTDKYVPRTVRALPVNDVVVVIVPSRHIVMCLLCLFCLLDHHADVAKRRQLCNVTCLYCVLYYHNLITEVVQTSRFVVRS